ncbi:MULTISPECIES: SNF2-related protein [unclassified Cryobacterium]|uniref:SNF2-related protein n=1 Tax=unclassified Cryobacterium TaxID=2649013 RepID=UPI00106C0B21|nr:MULTISPECIES: SNF2-related protein [unclassified Cryobacterium]TFC50418.1 DNA/RNA helicase [Cryobacterium sp. TMB3-1-2]TFC71847.1 DNA/RNA helicase [Cryobacterium sp. TMB3-15]TFC78440.1 DNA/RNA helicase [Cryobacterium sp. TMB3-10]TFD44497.1 DNA/RNA helicase [Cryobacterium sp. TMB3-12]
MPPTPPSPGAADWKSAVEALTGPAAAEPTLPPVAEPGDGARTAMGLLFELREQTPRSNDRWRGATAVRASAGRARTGAIRLGVRPVLRSDSGKWVKSTITWSNVGYQLNRQNLNVAQHRWFCQFVPLHRVDRPVYNGQDTEWLYLDEFESPLLWHLLAEAQRLGIGLTGSHKDAAVTVAATASVLLDAVQTTEALTLSPVLSIDGHRHPVGDAGALGDHGVYAYRLGADPAIVLAPSLEPLSAEQRRLLGGTGDRAAVQPGLVVPAGEVDEFLREYYPTLRRSLPIVSTDASIEFPPPPPPVLVHTVSFEPKQAVRLDWQWQGDRDEQAETEVLDRVTTAVPDLSAPADPDAPTVTLKGLPAAEYTDRTLPRLETIAGVRVQLVGDKPDYRELTGAPQLIVTTVETEKRDWFDLGVIVRIDGRSIPFNPIFTALAKGRKKLLLVDNSYLSLTQPVFDRLRELIEEARALSEWETGLRINRHQASLWSDFEDLADETEQAVSWRAAVGGLLALDRGAADAAALPRATPLPAGLTATLRPYQLAGFEWLVFLWEHGLGGILADDMGLGKTLQVLALLSHAVQTPADEPAETAEPRRPFLVVAPTSVVSNWLAEAARFTPGLRVRSVTSTQATSGRSLADQAEGVDVLVTSYALLRLDFDAYQAHGWSGLILDEAQFVKNRTSQLHRAARDLNVPFKLAVTGTPLENNLLELWAQFAIVAPGLFPSARRFTEEYLRPAERKVRSQRELIDRLRRRIRPLMLRRTKDVVARDLPAKQEQVLRIDLDPEHREIYDTFLQRERQKLLGLMDDLEANRFIVFRSITLLRMLSLDASLVDDQYAGVPSSKLDALFEQLDEVIAEGHRALIFSQFTSYLALAAARLDARGVRYSYLDGSTADRPGVIDQFKAGDAPVFLISLKAGGFGLNLTEADYVFLLDPWWNPASENQAIDRTHRIGQTRNVMVYRLVAADTIEEKVMALKESKAKLVEAVLDDDAVFAQSLTPEDIRGLLE